MSWRWDQGRMEYFQFDSIRKHAKYAVQHDLAQSTHGTLTPATGLSYPPIKPKYEPWRNFARVFKQMMIVAKPGKAVVSTDLGKLLAEDGLVTADEYFHFFAMSFTSSGPAYRRWKPTTAPRYPLLFALKFILARVAHGQRVTTFAEIIGAYDKTGFVGDEDRMAFLQAAKQSWAPGKGRQAAESIKVLAQISYLSATRRHVTVSLHYEDAEEVFLSLAPNGGPQELDGDQEIIRLTDLFESAVAGLELSYSRTVTDQTVEAGFAEGTRVERTHVALERNAAVRDAFFVANPTAECDFCDRDTKAEYPWTNRVLDIHHVLPLCSGTRSDTKGTVLSDLVAICPTCHRAVHRFYAKWLKEEDRRDFADADEASAIYGAAKSSRKAI